MWGGVQTKVDSTLFSSAPWITDSANEKFYDSYRCVSERIMTNKVYDQLEAPESDLIFSIFFFSLVCKAAVAGRSHKLLFVLLVAWLHTYLHY